MAALVAPLSALPPGAPDCRVVGVEHVLLVAGPDGRLLLPLQHLPVPAVLNIVLRLGEYQLPAHKTRISTGTGLVGTVSRAVDPDLDPHGSAFIFRIQEGKNFK